MYKVVLIGSTGVVGSTVLNDLINSQVVASVTTISRSPALVSDPKLRQVLIDEINFNELSKLSIDGDIFISALGTTLKSAKTKDQFREIDKGINLDFAKFAKIQNAKEFYIISALGADKNSFIFYNRIKGEIEDSITKLNFLKLVILRPSLLLADRNEFRIAEFVSIKAIKFISLFLPSFVAKKLGTYPKDISSRIIQSFGVQGSKVTVISDI